jgi:hypothetical protein
MIILELVEWSCRLPGQPPLYRPEIDGQDNGEWVWGLSAFIRRPEPLHASPAHPDVATRRSLKKADDAAAPSHCGVSVTANNSQRRTYLYHDQCTRDNVRSV